MNIKKIYTAYIEAIKKSLDFKGVSGRLDYWGFIVINAFILSILNLLLDLPPEEQGTILPVVAFLYSTLILLPIISSIIRRLHDTDNNASILIGFLGLLIIFLLTLKIVSIDIVGILSLIVSVILLGYSIYIFILLIKKGSHIEETKEDTKLVYLCIVFYICLSVFNYIHNKNIKQNLAETTEQVQNIAENNDENNTPNTLTATSTVEAPNIPMHNNE